VSAAPTFADVARVIADVLGVDAAVVRPDSSPDTIPAWDSVQHLNLVIALEEEFGARFTPEEIEKFDLHGRSRREDAGKTPDPYSISQLLRGAGCYLDNRNVSERVTISFAGRWITIRYETPDKQAANERHDLEYFYDCWVQMYLRRSNRAKLPQASEPTVIMTWQGLRGS